MKTCNLWFVLSLVCISLSASCGSQPAQPEQLKHYLSFAGVAELEQFFHWAPGKKPILAAHRGGPMPGYPENCLETFENILGYAPCLVECDIRKSKDGVLLLLHDEDLGKTTTGSGKVGDCAMAELKALKLKGRDDGKVTPYRIPTLEEALVWCRGKTVMELDVKPTVSPEEIVAMIAKHKAHSYTVVITYSWEAAQKYHTLDPDIMISASAMGLEGTKRLLACGINPRKLIGFVGVYEPEREVYDLLHQNGICAILGTLGNLDQKARTKGRHCYAEFVKNGADILATDDVPLAAQALAE